MNLLLVILVVVAVLLLIIGGITEAVSFLLWVGLVLLIVAAIAFLLRLVTGRRV
ncbi:MAG: hypothetical protein JWP66_1230 [Naasia sp.]|nr:hypothetical protein [Naasia sp.]